MRGSCPNPDLLESWEGHIWYEQFVHVLTYTSLSILLLYIEIIGRAVLCFGRSILEFWSTTTKPHKIRESITITIQYIQWVKICCFEQVLLFNYESKIFLILRSHTPHVCKNKIELKAFAISCDPLFCHYSFNFLSSYRLSSTIRFFNSIIVCDYYQCSSSTIFVFRWRIVKKRMLCHVLMETIWIWCCQCFCVCRWLDDASEILGRKSFM